MATHTLATSANLTAVTFSPSPNTLLPADAATIVQAIRQDPNVENAQDTGRQSYSVAGGFSLFNGLLYLPWNRGVIRVLPGDVIAVDTSTAHVAGGVGWPIVVSADAIANGSWTFT